MVAEPAPVPMLQSRTIATASVLEELAPYSHPLLGRSSLHTPCKPPLRVFVSSKNALPRSNILTAELCMEVESHWNSTDQFAL